MGKGVEDTAFYRYLRLVALNEVGGDPGRFSLQRRGLPLRATSSAPPRSPRQLLPSRRTTPSAAATCARGSERSRGCAPDGPALVRRWREINERLRSGPGPDANEEYLIYQTLVGTWPITPERLAAYLREGAARSEGQHQLGRAG